MQALQYAKQVVTGTTGKAMTPRLRDFHPALVGYALAGQADKAGEVVHYMMAHCQPTDLTGMEGGREGIEGREEEHEGCRLGVLLTLRRLGMCDALQYLSTYNAMTLG